MPQWSLSEVTADSKKGSHLIHAVDERTGEALCRRVKAENLTGYAPRQITAPTCPICLEKVRTKNPLSLRRSTSGKLYTNFTGRVEKRRTQTGIRYGNTWLTPKGQFNILIPKELAIIGHVNAIEYDCVRDGKRVKARHPFAPGCRPAFAVGTGSGQLFLLGTSFQFTDRGIVDYNVEGEAVDYDENSGRIKKLK